MKDSIIQSNKYKRYRYYLRLFSVIFGIIAFVLTLAIVTEVNNPNPKINSWVTFGRILGVYSLLFVPIILFYGIKLFLMRKNAESYQKRIGIITSIETAQFFRTDHREVTIDVSEIEQTVYAKVYGGELYDEVAKNIKVEVAINEKDGDVIILRVL